MRTAHWLPVTVAALVCGCTSGNPTTPVPPIAGPSTAATVTASTTPQSTTTPSPSSPTSPAEAIREWEGIAREHFKESAAALEQVSEASASEDEAGLRAGCQRLHDTNSVSYTHLTLPTNREV